ncbi:hypothetical protein LB542_11935 [Mesorhizobium sp. BR1-1-9]|uniref:hypothetical protein n=1 Tax=unclassified Mesorhizobium TaxID=325217 RepID=UPI001127AF75|nr:MULTISPECIES: hypothetical protein [unclassified Mesorhizobium]MBZ9806982.1 hypothetical protein [Mesorhizobium sp. ESP-6-2]MBZ9871563.1 hypothetical protein [Mesorhizobium sp. BR1-1-9]MBZ9940200.1 hypothetical protein [Mesorhizobium sp. BR1-1-13]TPM30356.1 hypothetical protein FJ955_11250 [Mesorhizobium sp. B2-2-2]
MTASRFSNVGISRSAMLLGILFSLSMAGAAAAPPADDLYRFCRQVRNDDTIRGYSPALRDGTVQAFKKLVPDAKGTPDDSELGTQAQYRCMNGKVMACFVGANLPCVKMNATRDNPGADEFCRRNPNEDGVPAVATGHDTVFSYRCRDGKAEVTGQTWKLDKRGFARKLWTALPDR